MTLSSNKITKIKGLDSLSNLREIDLSVNQLREIDGLKNLSKLVKLSLSINEIKDVEYLYEMPNLKIVILSHNDLSISQLKELKSHHGDLQIDFFIDGRNWSNPIKRF